MDRCLSRAGRKVGRNRRQPVRFCHRRHDSHPIGRRGARLSVRHIRGDLTAGDLKGRTRTLSVSHWLFGWSGGFIAGAITVWAGWAGIPIAAGFIMLLVLIPARAAVLPGGLVGLGSGATAIILYAASRCPEYVGGTSASCAAADLRPVVLIALATAALGLALTYRRTRGTPSGRT